MVTKLPAPFSVHEISSILAKIFMVTKLELVNQLKGLGSVLAKIHMVTKPQKYGSTFLNVIEY